jgi:hypothetical protein
MRYDQNIEKDCFGHTVSHSILGRFGRSIAHFKEKPVGLRVQIHWVRVRVSVEIPGGLPMLHPNYAPGMPHSQTSILLY